LFVLAGWLAGLLFLPLACRLVCSGWLACSLFICSCLFLCVVFWLAGWLAGLLAWLGGPSGQITWPGAVINSFLAGILATYQEIVSKTT